MLSPTAGLPLRGLLEALLASPHRSLTAVDLGFSSGLESAAVVDFVGALPCLGRCNLRAAAGVTASDYNAVGQLMLERSSQPDIIENRRRPRHLAPRPAAPFFYLKRG